MRRGDENMRKLLTLVVLVLTLGVAATLPAAADPGERAWRDWSEGPRYFHPMEQPQRRVGRADYSDRYYDEEARPRRRVYSGHRAERRHAKRHHAVRTAKKARRHQIARRPGKGQRKVATHLRRPHKPAAAAKLAPKVALAKPAPEAPSKRSLSTDGPRGGQHGVASYYWQGQRVASGGWFDPNAMTAAHKTLPFGTRVRVTHLGNGRSVEVKINDRGPFIAGRIIDLSKGAAGVIGMTAQGVARVAVEVLGR
jgi:rare lipoprotein A